MKHLKSFKQFESSMIGITGDINIPDCVSNDPEDDMEAAYQKGRDAAKNGYDLDDNPYISLNDEETNALQDNFYAWADGWNDFTSGTL